MLHCGLNESEEQVFLNLDFSRSLIIFYREKTKKCVEDSFTIRSAHSLLTSHSIFINTSIRVRNVIFSAKKQVVFLVLSPQHFY